VETGRVALGQLGHRVHPRRFQQIGKLLADTVDAEQVGAVDPLQDQVGADAGAGGQVSTAPRRCPLREQLLGSRDAHLFQPFGAGCHDPLDLGNA
jgi:hypothetical protein